MQQLKIDLDKDILYEVPVERRPPGGVIIRKDPATGADVFMYRKQPGVYYGPNGVEVSPIMARNAGFDIERLAAEREKQDKVQQFEAEWAKMQKTEARREVETRGQYKLVDLGQDRYIVEDMEGRNMTLNKQANTLEMGRSWLEFFAGPEVKPDGDVRGADGESSGGTDRRPGQDVGSDQLVRKPGRPKATVPA